ncbi:MAG: putative DNA binding domain-containing protein [Actinomycetota bacterium]|nr:putative DNA binding domain-containing protein [Actinomycetota bacterium]
MALSIDTSHALRGTAELRSLVNAVAAANEHDESHWIEWKSDLDLTTKDGCFQIARTVLAMANRLPERARTTCEGLGFVVVGVAPGKLCGITSVDPARLDQLIEPYLGSVDGPRWTPTFLQDRGSTVLVVTVEAPEPGDRIFTLRKEFGGNRSGTVFVRKQGRTVPADAEDLDGLQRRLTAAPRSSGASVDIRAVGDVPLSWIDPEATRPAIERWANRRRDDLIAQARAVERSRQEPEQPDEVDLTGLTSLQASVAAMARQQDPLRRAMRDAARLGSFLQEEDTRTVHEYIDQVNTWHERLVEASLEALPGAYVSGGHGVLAFEVENLGSRFLPDVEVEIRFDFDGAAGADEEPDSRRLPSPPGEYGKPKPRVDLLSSGLISPAIAPPYLPDLGGIGRRTWVEDGSIVVKFDIGDLRQHATDVSDDVYVFVSRPPEDGVLHGTWKATVRDVDGVLTGTIDVAVAREPVDVVKVLTTEPDD